METDHIVTQSGKKETHGDVIDELLKIRTEEGFVLKHMGHGVGSWADDGDGGDVYSTLLIWEKSNDEKA